MKTRDVLVALAALLSAPAGLVADDPNVAVELMKLNVSGIPSLSEGRTVGGGDTHVYSLPGPRMTLHLNVKATWITTALPGSLPVPLELTLISPEGRSVATATGRSPLTLSGQINANDDRFTIRVKNTNEMSVSGLKLSIGGRAGTTPGLGNKRRVEPSPSPRPGKSGGN